MAGDLNLKYGTPADFTVTNLHSLATSSSRVAGWSSALVDNTSDVMLDFLVSGEFKVHNTVAPTDKKSISVYAYAAYKDVSGTPTWPDLFSSGTEGSEGAATVHDEEQRDCGLALLWSCMNDAGTGEVYSMPPRSIAQAFGGVVPQKWCLWVVQDTGQALHSSGNALYRVPIEAQYS